MASVDRNENKQPETNDKGPNLDNFTKDGFKCLTGATKQSNALPTDSDWSFYKLNESFCRITNNEGERLSKLINSILRKYDIDENVNARKSLKDKVELIIETNDIILEKVSDNLDEINGIRKRNIQPVEFQTVTAELPTISGSWNRINKATFSISSSVNSPKWNFNSSKSIHLLTGKNIDTNMRNFVVYVNPRQIVFDDEAEKESTEGETMENAETQVNYLKKINKQLYDAFIQMAKKYNSND